MSAIPFDTLKFVEKLEAGGFTREQAKAAAEAFAEAAGQELATKGGIVGLRNELALLRSETQTGFQLLEQRMTIKLGGLIIAATGLILAALRYLPGGH